MSSTRKPQPPTFNFPDLTVWSTKLDNVKFAVSPPSNTRPNPLVADDRVYASIFAPGSICALDRESGKLLWRRDVGKFANASVYLHNGRLFAKSSNTLFALHPDSARILWSFSPYGTDGEIIYSSPTAIEDRVYIGDRKGYLHCLDAVNGTTIWKRRTNRTRNDDVNSTPLVIDGLVIVTTNAKTALAYHAGSGKLAWKQQLDAPSTFGPLTYQGSIVAVSDSVSIIGPTGRVQRRFSWRDENLQQVETTPRSIVVTFWPASLWEKPDPSKKPEPGRLRLIRPESGTERMCSVRESCSSIRYAPVTRLLYLSHLSGIDLLHATKGTVLCRLKTSEDPRNGVGLVDVRDKKIFALTGDGCVHALRHPPLRSI
jgi:hypothetical protein